MRVVAVAAVVLLLPLAPAVAQSRADLLACAAIGRDADRLACYDNAMSDASPEAKAAKEARARESARLAAEAAAAAAVAAKAKAEADAIARRDAFGAEGVASRSAERFKPDPGQVQEVEASITEMLTNRSGLGVFLLDNGQMWKQADTIGLPNIRIGDRVKITRTALGGYNLLFLKQKRDTPVKRIR